MEDLRFLGLEISELVSGESLGFVFRLLSLIFIALPLVVILSRRIRRGLMKRSAQYAMVAEKVVLYGGLIIIVLSVLREFGFTLTHVLGMAGIAGVALAFASQTSISNIISGMFLMAEEPFIVGDIVKIDQTTGVVLSVDMLSVKLRTFDNQYVRIPNENIIKGQVTTITKYPIRRVDLNVGVAYKENISRVREALLDVAFINPLCLQEPEPQVIFSGYGNSSVDLLFAVWVATPDWRQVRNELIEQVKARFDGEGIEIPFPHLSLYKGLATEPFPVQLVAGERLAPEPDGGPNAETASSKEDLP
ncbi:mechanosensitive ion channel family protein [Candidatus Sumerlaeota bacterium]